jgi:hypothetical protein
MPGRIEAKKFGICHVRQPSHGMVVAMQVASEGPGDASPGQTVAYKGILGNIVIIIVVHETIIPHLLVDSKRHHHEQKADDDLRTIAAHFRIVSG